MKSGIISAGNWLVDFVKIIGCYPNPGNLTSIENIKIGLGGCSHNVLVDLANLKPEFNLYAGGCVGDDENGKYVISEIDKYGIDKRFMFTTPLANTSYTDVMSVKDGSSRTYFHYRGANALLDITHIDKMECNAKIFHLGYLLLLDKLDADDPEYGIVAAKALKILKDKGYKTSIDLVSEQSDRYKHVVLPTLPYVDYMIINEVEASACCDLNIRNNDGSLSYDNIKKAAQYLLNKGVSELVAIHMPEGGYVLNKKGEDAFLNSYPINSSEIVSTVGAGDAFCAGMLYAIHESKSITDSLKIALANARFNLLSPTSTGGAVTYKQVCDFINKKQL